MRRLVGWRTALAAPALDVLVGRHLGGEPHPPIARQPIRRKPLALLSIVEHLAPQRWLVAQFDALHDHLILLPHRLGLGSVVLVVVRVKVVPLRIVQLAARNRACRDTFYIALCWRH
eukprot:3939387-Prymnesium_polylepis.1